MRRAVIAHHDIDAAHAVPSDDADLDLAALSARRDYRSETAFGKISVFDRLVAVLKRLAEVKVERFEMGLKQAEIGRRQGRQQVIGVIRRWRLGHGSSLLGQERESLPAIRALTVCG